LVANGNCLTKSKRLSNEHQAKKGDDTISLFFMLAA
jgi:hypothetical protein